MNPFAKIISAPVRMMTPPQSLSQEDVARIFARCFSTDDGRKVLSHLQVMTFSRAYGPESSDHQLRYAEGQRALVAQIMRLVDRGRA